MWYVVHRVWAYLVDTYMCNNEGGETSAWFGVAVLATALLLLMM